VSICHLLAQFKAETGTNSSQPIPLQHFIGDGNWYQQKAAPKLDRRQVKTVEKNGSGFKVTLDDGQTIKSPRVVIATGIAPFPWIPKEFEGLPKSGFPNLFRRLPHGPQDRIGRRAVRPAGTVWQRRYLAKVPITVNCRVALSS